MRFFIRFLIRLAQISWLKWIVEVVTGYHLTVYFRLIKPIQYFCCMGKVTATYNSHQRVDWKSDAHKIFNWISHFAFNFRLWWSHGTILDFSCHRCRRQSRRRRRRSPVVCPRLLMTTRMLLHQNRKIKWSISVYFHLQIVKFLNDYILDW